VQIVVNCETRICSQFLGPGDHFLRSYGAIFTDRAATGSGNLKNSMSTGVTKFSTRVQKLPFPTKLPVLCPWDFIRSICFGETLR
jgi:hypothetical protein